MAQQTVSNFIQPIGNVGEFYSREFIRVQTKLLKSTDGINNIIGSVAFASATDTSVSIDDQSSNLLYGILVNPNTYVRASMATTIIVPNDTMCSIAQQGYVFVKFKTGGKIGSTVWVSTTDYTLACDLASATVKTGYIKIPNAVVSVIDSVGTDVIGCMYFNINL